MVELLSFIHYDGTSSGTAPQQPECWSTCFPVVLGDKSTERYVYQPAEPDSETGRAATLLFEQLQRDMGGDVYQQTPFVFGGINLPRAVEPTLSQFSKIGNVLALREDDYCGSRFVGYMTFVVVQSASGALFVVTAMNFSRKDTNVAKNASDLLTFFYSGVAACTHRKIRETPSFESRVVFQLSEEL